MGDKGNLVVNFEVKNKIFRSHDSLNRTSNRFFKTLEMEVNRQNLLEKTDVYAKLIKSGR